MTLQLYLDIATLLIFLSFNVLGLCVTARPNYRLQPGVNLQLPAGLGVGRTLPTPAPTPTQAKTGDSDRLQFRYRPRLRSLALDRF